MYAHADPKDAAGDGLRFAPLCNGVEMSEELWYNSGLFDIS